MNILQLFVKYIEKFTIIQGIAIRWLIYPLIFVLNYEIISRYLFNKPTIWAYDLTYILYGSFFMIGGAFTLLKDKHVKIEYFYTKMKKRYRSLIEILGYLLFFFPSMTALGYFGVKFTYHSWLIDEKAGSSIFAPTIWPFKAIIPISAIFLILIGMTIFLKHCFNFFGREL